MRSMPMTLAGDNDSVRQRWRFSPPDNEIPVPIALNAVLGRSGDVAVALCGACAYSTGVEFDLVIRVRPRPGRRPIWDLVRSHHQPDEPVDDMLLLGFEYADGTTVANLPPGGRRPPADPGAADQPMLTERSGGGGDREYTQSWWLTPLPPPGPLRAVFRWSAMDLPETAVQLDGTALAEAGRAAEILWPWEPDPPTAEPATPPGPSFGWFATARPHEPDPG